MEKHSQRACRYALHVNSQESHIRADELQFKRMHVIKMSCVDNTLGTRLCRKTSLQEKYIQSQAQNVSFKLNEKICKLMDEHSLASLDLKFYMVGALIKRT